MLSLAPDVGRDQLRNQHLGEQRDLRVMVAGVSDGVLRVGDVVTNGHHGRSAIAHPPHRLVVEPGSGEEQGAIVERLRQVDVDVRPVAGLAGAVVLSRWIEGLLFGVSPTDPLTFAAVIAVLVAVATAACSIPAWRATRVDPTQALRAE